jgi:hypothetical protein
MKPTGYASFLNSDEETAIFAALTNVTQTQFAQVFKAFGNLPYNATFGNQSQPYFTTLDKHDLKFWLQTELGQNTESYRTLKQKYPNYL